MGPMDAMGEAGASAQREHERKRQRRIAEAESRGGLVKVLAFLSGPSATDKRRAMEEANWATGARGEQRLAQAVAGGCPGALMLHDRRMPASRANIDHIAVAVSGVYVVDAKCYRGTIKVVSPIFGPPRLMIAGRNRTKLIGGLDKQVAVVKAMLSEIAPDVPVHGCLCFLKPEGPGADGGLPLLRRLSIGGYPLYSQRRLIKRLNSAGALSEERALVIHGQLAERLRPA